MLDDKGKKKGEQKSYIEHKFDAMFAAIEK